VDPGRRHPGWQPRHRGREGGGPPCFPDGAGLQRPDDHPLRNPDQRRRGARLSATASADGTPPTRASSTPTATQTTWNTSTRSCTKIVAPRWNTW